MPSAFPIAPGVSSAQSQQRHMRVFNASMTVTIPPYACLEISGYNNNNGSFTVRQPTISNRNDLLFNDFVGIPPQSLGQAVTGPYTLAGIAPAGVMPASGQIWGCAAGAWFLQANGTGYVIRDVPVPDQNIVVVSSMMYTLSEWVYIVNPNGGSGAVSGSSPDPGSLPSSYYDALLTIYNFRTDMFENTTTKVWYRDRYKGNPKVTNIIRSSYEGWGPLSISDQRAIYVGVNDGLGGSGGSGGSGNPNPQTRNLVTGLCFTYGFPGSGSGS
jgi:hypothetical protein